MFIHCLLIMSCGSPRPATPARRAPRRAPRPRTPLTCFHAPGRRRSSFKLTNLCGRTFLGSNKSEAAARVAVWREFPSTRTKITFALNFRRALSWRNKLRLLEVRRAVRCAARPQASPVAQCHRPNGLRFVYMGKSFVPDTVKCHASVTKFLNLLHQHWRCFLPRAGRRPAHGVPATCCRGGARSQAAAWRRHRAPCGRTAGDRTPATDSPALSCPGDCLCMAQKCNTSRDRHQECSC